MLLYGTEFLDGVAIASGSSSVQATGAWLAKSIALDGGESSAAALAEWQASSEAVANGSATAQAIGRFGNGGDASASGAAVCDFRSTADEWDAGIRAARLGIGGYRWP